MTDRPTTEPRTDTIKAPPPQTRMGAMIHEEEPIRVRLCDDAGMVSHQRVEPGSPGTIFDPDLTYLKLLNNLRAKNRNPDAQVPYTGEPFVCTGSAHLAGQAFVCVNPIHANAAARLGSQEGSAE